MKHTSVPHSANVALAKIEFSCPYSPILSPQNNPENVRQDIRAKHKGQDLLSIRNERSHRSLQ